MKINNTFTFCDKCFKQIKWKNEQHTIAFRFLDIHDEEQEVTLCPLCFKMVGAILSFKKFKNHGEELETIKDANKTLDFEIY